MIIEEVPVWRLLFLPFLQVCFFEEYCLQMVLMLIFEDKRL